MKFLKRALSAYGKGNFLSLHSVSKQNAVTWKADSKRLLSSSISGHKLISRFTKTLQKELESNFSAIWRISGYNRCYLCNMSKFQQTRHYCTDQHEDSKCVTALYQGLVGGDRGSLARSITLLESTNNRKKIQAKMLLNFVLQNNAHSLRSTNSLRIGNYKLM